MQAMLVLYMVDQLLQPGHVENILGFATLRTSLEKLYGPLDPQPLSSVIFGLYTSLVFFMPVFGGVLGDRLVGQHRMVMTGAVTMAAGHFLMAFEKSFLVALLLLIVGCGCLKGNITSQVAALYPDGDRRRADAFQVFSMATQAGVILAPLVCGTLGEVYGWHYGFGAAGFGMLIGLVTYIVGRHHLPMDQHQTECRAHEPLLPAGGRLFAVLAVVFALCVCFLAAAGQMGNVYSLWLKSNVDRRLFGSITIPVTWFQSLSPIATVALTPVIMARWRQAARAPALLARMGGGLAYAAVGLLWLGLLSLLAANGGIAWYFVLPVHVLIALGFIHVYPVGLALFSRLAPVGGRAMLIGIFFLSSFVASNLVGWIGRYYQAMRPPAFWVAQTAICASGALVALILGRAFRRWLPAE